MHCHTIVTRLAIALMFAVCGRAVRGDPPAVAIVGGIAFVVSPERPGADPFPIRRVLLPANRAFALAGQAGDAPLRRMPREEFESLVRAATKNLASKSTPKLAKAIYRATLTDDGLTGTGEWTVQAATPQAMCILEPLRIAIGNPKWVGGTEALIARPPTAPTSAALWIEHGGSSAITFDWSTHGIEEPGEMKFDLRVPAAPIATLEIDLPTDRVPIPAQSDTLLTGPFPAAANRAIWKIAFGGSSKVEFSVRSTTGVGQLLAFARASRMTRYDLSPGLATVTYEFDFTAVRGPSAVREFLIDPGVQITDVVAAGLDRWQVQPNAVATKPATLTLQLREPMTTGRVVLSGFALAPTGGEPWVAPMVRPLAAALADDSIESRFAADVKLEGWDGGDYRLMRIAQPSDRSQTLVFKGIPTTTEAIGRRAPTFALRAVAAEWTTKEQVDWRIESTRMTLTARYQLQIVRGPLTQIAFKIPVGYTPILATATPADPSAIWNPGPNGTWIFEPTRPLSTGQTIELRVEVRRAAPEWPTAANRILLPVPKLIPLGASSREGTRTVSLGTIFRGWMTPTIADAGALPDGSVVPFAFRGNEPDGTLVLARRRSVVTAFNDVTVSTTNGERTAVHRLNLKVERGELASMVLYLPLAAKGNWTFDAPGADVRLQPHPGAAFLPGFAPLLVPGPFWQVTFVRPLRTAATITIRYRGPADAKLPLPVALGMDTSPPRITVEGRDETIEAEPLDPTAEIPTFTTLRPRGQLPIKAEAKPWRITDVSAVTVVDDAGRTTVTLRGQIATAGGRMLMVPLPEGAEVESILIEGKWVDARGEGTLISIPIPAPDDDPDSFELRYRLPGEVRWPLGNVHTAILEFPGRSDGVRESWEISPKFAIWPDLGRTVPHDRRQVWLVPASVPVLAGYLLAIAIFALGLVRLKHGRAASRTMFLFALALGTASWVVTPGWQLAIRPSLVVSLLAGVAFAMIGRVDRSSASRAAAAAVAIFAAFATVVGQPVEPVTVYLIPGPTEAPDRLSVLVPQAVTDRLTSLLAPELPAVLLTAAEYTGADTDGLTAFDATFTLHVTRDGTQTFALPLTGIRLESIRLDGAVAFPDATRPDRYTISLEGKGERCLKVRFSVPSLSVGGEREVRFGIPDLPSSRVRFTAGPTAKQVNVVSRRGSQIRTGTATVDADHGGGHAVAIRWRQGGTADTPPRASVTEATIWDIGESEAYATAAFNFRIDGGALSRFTFDIPPDLEPGRATIRTADTTAINGVRSWKLAPAANGWQTLTIEAQNLVDGAATIAFRLVPHAPLSVRPALFAPRAYGASVVSSYVGVRLRDAVVERWNKENLIDFPADAIARDFATVPELLLEKQPLSRSFRREGTGVPAVRPILRGTVEPVPTGQEIIWTIGPRADVAGTVRWPRDVAAFALDFEIPGAVTPTDVQATDIIGWARKGNRVRVWFRSEVKEPTVRWSGIWSGYIANSVKPVEAVELPTVTGTSVRVRAFDGWVIVPQANRNAKPLPPLRPRELAFAIEPNAPALRLTITPPPTVADVRIWKSIERADTAIAYRAIAEVHLPAGRLHHITVQLGPLPPSSDVKLELPLATILTESTATPTTRRWEIQTPADAQSSVRLACIVRLPSRAGFVLPRWEIASGGVPIPIVGRYLAVGSPDIQIAQVSENRRSSWPAVVPPELESLRGRATFWTTSSEEPIALRIVEPTLAPPAPQPRPSFAVPLATATDTPAVHPALAALGWFLGMSAVGLIRLWGPRHFRPELLVAFGVLAAFVGGSGFLLVVVFGLLARAWRLWQILARRILR